MRHFIFTLATVLLCSFCTWFITDHAAKAQAHSAAVVADEEHGVIRVMIDGREIARFDRDGLFVDGRVGATGALLPPAVAREPAPGPEGGAP